MKTCKLLIIILLFPISSYSRVFDFNKYTVGTYLKGNIGLTSQDQAAYKNSSGANSIFADSPNFNWGGEVGILFSKKSIGMRLGYELISPQKQSGIKATDAGGTELLTLESSIVGAFPVGHIEIYAANEPTYRAVFSVGGGYGSISLKNSYSNIVGYAASSYIEKASNTTYMLEAGSGFEFLFTDNVTMLLDLGYRYVPKKDLKADSAFTDVYGNNIAKGDFLLNADGTKRTVDLSGIWAGVSFRFYIRF